MKGGEKKMDYLEQCSEIRKFHGKKFSSFTDREINNISLDVLDVLPEYICQWEKDLGLYGIPEAACLFISFVKDAEKTQTFATNVTELLQEKVKPSPETSGKSLLEILLEVEGCSDIGDFLDRNGYDSVLPGICRNCKETTTECEPDATKNFCYNCKQNSVVSILVLCGM